MSKLKWWQVSKQNKAQLLVLAAIVAVYVIYSLITLIPFYNLFHRSQISTFHVQLHDFENQVAEYQIPGQKITQKTTNDPAHYTRTSLGNKPRECVEGSYYKNFQTGQVINHPFDCSKLVTAYYGLNSGGLNSLRNIETALENNGWSFDRTDSYFIGQEKGVASAIANYSISATQGSTKNLTINLYPKSTCGTLELKDICSNESPYNFVLRLQYYIFTPYQ